MRILVVEDDKVLHHLIAKRLKEEGHSVDDCYDGESGFDYADSMQYDCIILDLMLPKRDGISILRELRNKGNASPVLILTARDSIDDRVVGLDAGADDYLVKPFAFDEFSARVRALLRRGSDTKSTVLSLADLTLNTTNRKIVRGERNITLTSTEYALLEYLLRNQGHVLSGGCLHPVLEEQDRPRFSCEADSYRSWYRVCDEGGRMKLTIKRRIMLLYTLLTTILLGILLPIVYVTVSASLNLDIQSRLNNAIAQVLIAVDDQDEKFVLNDQVDLPDYISMCVTDGNGKLIFSTPGGECSHRSPQIQPGIPYTGTKPTQF